MPSIREKPLETPDQNTPQIREYIDAIERGKDALHIFPSESGWRLKKIGGEDIEIFDTVEEALSGAYAFAENDLIPVSAIITHDENGLISERVDDPSASFTMREETPGSWSGWLGKWLKARD